MAMNRVHVTGIRTSAISHLMHLFVDSLDSLFNRNHRDRNVCQNLGAFAKIGGNRQPFTERVNLLKPLADSMEKAILFYDIDNQEYEEFVRNCQRFVPLRITPSSTNVEDNEKLRIMTHYGVEILETILIDTEMNKAIITKNLDVAAKILNCKRARLNDVTSRVPDMEREISRERGRLRVAENDLGGLCNHWIIRMSKRCREIKIRRLTITATIRNLRILKFEMNKLKKEIYEVDGLKNTYSTIIDNLKTLKQFTLNINANSKKVSGLIEECGTNIDECYTIVPIRDAIAKLKREGKGFWDYLQNNP